MRIRIGKNNALAKFNSIPAGTAKSISDENRLRRKPKIPTATVLEKRKRPALLSLPIVSTLMDKNLKSFYTRIKGV
jgi:hypothetical protein